MFICYYDRATHLAHICYKRMKETHIDKKTFNHAYWNKVQDSEHLKKCSMNKTAGGLHWIIAIYHRSGGQSFEVFAQSYDVILNCRIFTYKYHRPFHSMCRSESIIWTHYFFHRRRISYKVFSDWYTARPFCQPLHNVEFGTCNNWWDI